jgi:hypothetical protein
VEEAGAYLIAILLRNGTLPEVWIPPSELRDQRELLRMRIFLVHLKTRVKNRIHGTLARHNVVVPGADLFGVEARLRLESRLPELPLHSRGVGAVLSVAALVSVHIPPISATGPPNSFSTRFANGRIAASAPALTNSFSSSVICHAYSEMPRTEWAL